VQRVDRLAGLGIGLLGAAVILTARTFPNVPGQDLGASTLPMIVGIGLVVCALMLVRRSFNAARYASAGEADRRPAVAVALAVGAQAPPAPDEAPLPTIDRGGERIGPPLTMLAAILVYVLLSERLGYPLVAPLTLMIALLALRVRLPRALAWSIGASLLVHLAFYKLLRVPLPWGIVPPLY
jgi:putative tricarboxylic transport membrane protein